MTWRRLLVGLMGCLAGPLGGGMTTAEADALSTLAPPGSTQAAMVKLFGAGGVAGLEGYQSGVCIDPAGTVLTVGGVLLDGGVATVVNAVGDRYEARLIGVDHRTGAALLRPDTPVEPPGWIEVTALPAPEQAETVWVFSNAFAIAAGDEPVSVQRCRVAAIAPMPRLTGRRSEVAGLSLGAPAAGQPVLLLDGVTSNPGAAGGAVVDQQGRLRGLVGSEARSPLTGAWLNYATPVAAIRQELARMQSGERPASRREHDPGQDRRLVRGLGFRFVPRVSARTPAYVEDVEPGSAADRAGCLPDDLIVSVEGATVGTVEAASEAIADHAAERAPTVSLTLLRGGRVVTLDLAID